MTTAVRSPDTASAHYFVFELQSAAEELKRQGSDKVDSYSPMCLPFFPTSFQTPQIGHACTELLDKKTNKIRKATWSSSSPLRQLQNIREEIKRSSRLRASIFHVHQRLHQDGCWRQRRLRAKDCTSTYTTWSSSFQLQPI
ncbi:hypothetical protein YC2023_024336 [Brassica napus]